MNILSIMTATDWLILILVAVVIGGAFWLINDTRKKGTNIGGKLCGGCPHYCQMDRNCDGTPKKKTASDSEQA